MDDARSTDPDLKWVSDLLAAQPSPQAPDDVVGRVLQALGDEQSAREPAAGATDSLLSGLLNGSGGDPYHAKLSPSHPHRPSRRSW
ncbi:MAG: hypothetical protein LKI24_09230 [Acidipropionibacterium sp.]|jgi:hypothetical protein|nr:hypothetical protein [Acidipropionibacterium sp.]